MSNLLQALTGILYIPITSLSELWDVLGDLLTGGWKYIGEPLVESAFRLLGVHDEDVISTEVVTQRIIKDTDAYAKTINKLAIEHEHDPDGTVISHLTQLAEKAKARFGVYYQTGKRSADGLPYTNIRTSYLPAGTELTQAIESELNVSNITVVGTTKEVPTKEQWVAYKLYVSNSYDASVPSLKINNVTYGITSIDYNYSTDKYDVTCSATIATTVITITTVTEVTTVVTETATGAVISTTTTSSTDTDSGLPVGVTTSTTTSDDVTSGNTTTITTTATSTAVTTTVNVVDTQILTVDAFSPNLYAIAEFHTQYDTVSANWWCYELGSGTYPTIDASNTDVGELPLMPIVSIRHNGVNVNANKTTTEYKEHKALLEALGLNIDTLTDSISASPDINNVLDAYAYLALNLSDDVPVVNKLVYETFSQLYEDGGLYTDGVTDAGYTAVIKEGNYNLVLGWKAQNKSILTTSIGPIGTYKKIISGANMIIQKQATAAQCIQYELTGVMGMTLIERSGLYGTVSRSLGQGIEVPLGFFVIRVLSFKEQLDLLPYALKLSIYAAVITHLEWYQTQAFADKLKIIAVIVAIVVTVITWGSASSLAAALIDTVESLAVGLAAGYALHLLMASNAPDWLKVVGSVALIAVAAVYANEGVIMEGLPTAQTLSTVATMFGTGMSTYAQLKMTKLKQKESTFTTIADRRQKEIDDANTEFNAGLSTQTVQSIAVYDPVKEYLTSTVDYMMYVARDIQYDYSSLYNYDVLVKDFYDNKLRVTF